MSLLKISPPYPPSNESNNSNNNTNIITESSIQIKTNTTDEESRIAKLIFHLKQKRLRK